MNLRRQLPVDTLIRTPTPSPPAPPAATSGSPPASHRYSASRDATPSTAPAVPAYGPGFLSTPARRYAEESADGVGARKSTSPQSVAGPKRASSEMPPPQNVRPRESLTDVP
jgi:hypothetical protein